MATGTVLVFDIARGKMIAGDWASTDEFYLAICDNTTVPAVTTATPVIGDFTQVGAAGSYTTNGTSLGALSTLVTTSGSTMTFDSAINPTWAQDPSNDVDAYWGLIYNFTDAGKDALAFVELGGAVDMSAGSLTVTWSASGIFTI